MAINSSVDSARERVYPSCPSVGHAGKASTARLGQSEELVIDVNYSCTCRSNCR